MYVILMTFGGNLICHVAVIVIFFCHVGGFWGNNKERSGNSL